MNNSIKKYMIGGGLIAVFVGYLIFSSQNSTPIVSQNPSSGGGTSPSTSTSGTPTGGTGGSGSTGAGTPPANGGSGGGGSTGGGTQASGQYKDGTYTGGVADAFYGNLQVTAIVSGGKLTDVQFPVYPNDGGHTMEVSQFALPALKQEAIAAQSAQVDAVSGATDTSAAFQQSLGSALSQAKA